ncbi:MAG TPA: farnesyl diphosphate synthase [Thermoanaerobaculia bacterium]|nr:farnesyl diphosphate synthase [Thermoanaerobaculia bacterium]
MNPKTMTIGEYLRDRRALVDRAIDQNLPSAATEPPVIHEAMRYAVLGGGKRIRPILAIAAAEALAAPLEPLLVAFAALELIHTYSLVHDDLPALDDDDLRRGRKTTHVVFGEAMGILTGDALLTEAFSWLSRPIAGVAADRQLRAIATVAQAADSTGMIGGQVADLEASGVEGGSSTGRPAERPASTLDHLRFIHRNKTGKLITASVLLGGILGGASEEKLVRLAHYGSALGLAFQIVDDLLDQEESSEALGKTAGKDLAQGKLTYPALVGAAAARAEIAALLATARENADMIAGPVNYLAEIARFICERRS